VAVTPEQDDVALVQAFRAGDRKAFETLVRRHQKPVWAIANRFARNQHVAEDLAQKAFLLALERIDELRGAFRPWLLRITANLAKNYLRDNARLVQQDPDAEPPESSLGDPLPLPDEAYDSADRQQAVRLAVAGLPERQREVVLLRIDGQLPFAEIGTVLGITENNAKVTFHHAVRKLREALGGRDAVL
jgi:RNA polymerase sigma-70 factor (ECF subfamily)